MSMTDAFDPGPIIRKWWGDHLGDRQSGAARGLSARLRRGQGVEVMAELAVHTLARDLNSRDSARLIRVARVLAELRGDSDTELPGLLGKVMETNPDPKKIRRLLSHSRFRTLMRADGEELTIALIRAVRALGPTDSRACAIGALGRDLWRWDDKTRARWSFDYFGAVPPASLDPESTDPTDSVPPEEATA